MRYIKLCLIALTALFVVIVLPTFNRDHVMDFGTTSDIIIAISNIVMAGAALAAYLLAKDYFSDMVKKDGYEITKVINLELMPKLERTLNLSVINILNIEVPLYLNGDVGVWDEEVSTLNISLKRDLDSLIEKYKENLKVTTELRELKKSLETYGWRMIKSKEIEIDKLLDMNTELFIHIRTITIYLRNFITYPSRLHSSQHRQITSRF
ncbi:hypothetical protein [Rahnella sp. R3(2024)]|uniref:hypothetical protein n=1 Tax=Rahnella sp. R3(2024) TaxID=3163550 RepID=UPI0036E8690F